MLGSQSGVLGKNSTKVKSGLQGFFFGLFSLVFPSLVNTFSSWRVWVEEL